MKKSVLIFIFLTSSTISFCQKDLPNSTANIGIGIGVPYGGIGAKTVIGIRNSGLLIGLGKFPNSDYLGYMVGLQLSNGPIYFSLGYGLVGLVRINNAPFEPINGGIILMGGMVPLGKTKRTFIDFGLGTSFGAKHKIGSYEIKSNVVIVNFGFGYRIGNSK